jgi:hypothetical protein
MTDATPRPAYYAARPGSWRDWWTILHPPYTAWHLSYVVLGAALAPNVDGGRLLATLLAFFLAVGISAHVFDELHGRPLHTRIPDAVLVAVGAISLLAAFALGLAGIGEVGPLLLVFVVAGPLLVLGYNLELFGGLVHTDAGFAAAWGAFPVLTAYFVQAERLSVAAVVGAAAAFALSLAQRALSTRARWVRRRVTAIDGTATTTDGSTVRIDERMLLEPVERALHALALAMAGFGVALALARVL